MQSPQPPTRNSDPIARARESVIELGNEQLRARLFAERVAFSVGGTAIWELALMLFLRRELSLAALFAKPYVGFTILVLVGALGALPYALLRLREATRELKRDEESLARLRGSETFR